MKMTRAFVMLALLAGAASSARAEVLFDNIANGQGLGANVANLGAGLDANGDGYLAQSFSTGSGQVMLADIVLSLFWNNDPGSFPSGVAQGSFVVELFKDAGGNTPPTPGVDAPVLTLGVVNDNDLPGGVSTFDGHNTILQPMTRYWVVVSDPYTGTDPYRASIVQWEQGNDETGTGVSGEYAFSDGGPPTLVNSQGLASPFVMTVDMPEPSSLALTAIALSAIGFGYHRRRRTADIRCA